MRTDPPAETPPDFSIILVSWNNREYLDLCLLSIYKGGINHSFDIVVVDNGSADGSLEMLRQKYPQARVISNRHNVGLGKASNQGIEATSGRHILLLNNDTIVNGASLDAMAEYLDNHPRVGAVGGKLLNADRTVQSCYQKFSTLKEEFLIATRLGDLLLPGYPADVSAETLKSVDWMVSACLMVRRGAIDEVGLLDEEYFIYGDEVDLQYRLKKAGWQNHYLPQATAIHFGGRSMNRWSRRKMVYRGKMIFYKKNYVPSRAAALRMLLGVLSSLKILFWVIALILQSERDRVVKEIGSNIEVVKLCIHLV